MARKEYWRMVSAHFSESEFNNPERIEETSLLKLYNMRKEEGLHSNILIHVNEDYADSGHASGSYHGRDGICRAFDIVIKDKVTGEALPILEQFMIALRYGWNGIGFYPYWITPGLHVESVEMRTRRALWFRDRDGKYKHPLAYRES